MTNAERLASRLELAKQIPDFGNGKYSKFAEQQFKRGIVILGFTPSMAEKHARKASSDFGAIQKTAIVEGKVGSVKKDGDIVTKEMAEAQGKCTDSLLVVIACQFAEKAGKNGLSYGFTDWQLDMSNDGLKAYVAWLQEVPKSADKILVSA